MAPVSTESESTESDDAVTVMIATPNIAMTSLSHSSGETYKSLNGDEGELSSTIKKKKKKKPKKSAKAKESAATAAGKAKIPPETNGLNGRPPVLCISRNKHWRYISSYHV